MTKKFLLRSLSLSIALLLPNISFAHKGPPPFPASFDLNSDGTITATEVQTTLAADFVKADTNTDSYVSLSEMIAFHQTLQLTRFNGLDTDVSASLSLTEFEAADTHLTTAKATELFNLIDTDANAALTLDEFSVMEPSKGEIIRHFADADTDGDSKLSQAEFTAGPGGAKPAKSGTSTSTTTGKTKKAKK